MRVPLPGPSSTSCSGGAPILSHSLRIHTPRHSPNIWLISGDVTKSPRAPSTSDFLV